MKEEDGTYVCSTHAMNSAKRRKREKRGGNVAMEYKPRREQGRAWDREFEGGVGESRRHNVNITERSEEHREGHTIRGRRQAAGQKRRR